MQSCQRKTTKSTVQPQRSGFMQRASKTNWLTNQPSNKNTNKTTWQKDCQGLHVVFSRHALGRLEQPHSPPPNDFELLPTSPWPNTSVSRLDRSRWSWWSWWSWRSCRSLERKQSLEAAFIREGTLQSLPGKCEPCGQVCLRKGGAPVPQTLSSK